MDRYEFDLTAYGTSEKAWNVIVSSGLWSILGTVILVCLKGSLLISQPWYYCLVPIGVWLVGSIVGILILDVWLTILERKIDG
jgi:hypothetical protein